MGKQTKLGTGGTSSAPLAEDSVYATRAGEFMGEMHGRHFSPHLTPPSFIVDELAGGLKISEDNFLRMSSGLLEVHLVDPLQISKLDPQFLDVSKSHQLGSVDRILPASLPLDSTSRGLLQNRNRRKRLLGRSSNGRGVKKFSFVAFGLNVSIRIVEAGL
jgi:hypothetical protein